MRVAAISLAEINLTDLVHYRNNLVSTLKKTSAAIAVLPAYSSILLGISTGSLKTGSCFKKTIQLLLSDSAAWNNTFLELHSSISSELQVYLAAGTLIEINSKNYYHTAYCFNPLGEICGKQRQTHLTRAEREMGFSRGEELDLFLLNNLKAGLVIGNDARHPEVGRIFGLLGADLLLYSGATERGFNCWLQAAGIWSQVQQNQFWAVEAQLSGRIAERCFGADSAIIGPCEITPGQSGYLARGYPETPSVSAGLDETARSQLKEKYSLLKLLHPEAYLDLYSL